MKRSSRASAREYEQAETDAERMHVGQKLHVSIITVRASATAATLYIS